MKTPIARLAALGARGLGLAAAGLALAPLGSACESCRAALAQNAGLGQGLNLSILFMQAVVFFAIPGGMGFAIWRAQRANQRAKDQGQGFQPAGKIRWEEPRGDGSRP